MSFFRKRKVHFSIFLLILLLIGYTLMIVMFENILKQIALGNTEWRNYALLSGKHEN